MALYRECGRKQIDGTVCDGEMKCIRFSRPPYENMFECSKCGRRASGSKLMLENREKQIAKGWRRTEE